MDPHPKSRKPVHPTQRSESEAYVPPHQRSKNSSPATGWQHDNSSGLRTPSTRCDSAYYSQSSSPLSGMTDASRDPSHSWGWQTKNKPAHSNRGMYDFYKSHVSAASVEPDQSRRSVDVVKWQDGLVAPDWEQQSIREGDTAQKDHIQDIEISFRAVYSPHTNKKDIQKDLQAQLHNITMEKLAQTDGAEGGKTMVFLNEGARVYDRDMRADIRTLMSKVDRLSSSVSPVYASDSCNSGRLMASSKLPRDSILQLPHDAIDSIAEDVRRLKTEMDMQRADNMKLTENLSRLKQSQGKLTHSHNTLRRENGSLEKRVEHLQYKTEKMSECVYWSEDIRDRFIEVYKRDYLQEERVNQVIIQKGNRIAHWGSALGDAGLWDNKVSAPRRGPDEDHVYTAIYGVSRYLAQVVRDCRELEKLLDRCGSISVNRWLKEEEKAAFKDSVRRLVETYCAIKHNEKDGAMRPGAPFRLNIEDAFQDHVRLRALTAKRAKIGLIVSGPDKGMQMESSVEPIENAEGGIEDFGLSFDNVSDLVDGEDADGF